MNECTPSCMVCVEVHLTGSANCKGKFRRLQRPGNKQGAPRSKTSKTSGNGGASSGKSGQATGPAPANKTSKKDKNTNACGQSAKTPVSQEGNLPSLDSSKAATTKVSNWAGVAATLSSSPSPLELELKKEMAFLGTKNEQLKQKINALKSGRTEPPLPGTPDSGDESASLFSGVGPVTYGPLMSNLESRMTALEKSVTDQMAPLPTMIAQIIQAQMQQLVTTLTQQITVAATQNVKSWIQASPKLFRRAGPVKEATRLTLLLVPYRQMVKDLDSSEPSYLGALWHGVRIPRPALNSTFAINRAALDRIALTNCSSFRTMQRCVNTAGVTVIESRDERGCERFSNRHLKVEWLPFRNAFTQSLPMA
ncbi:hypothetical protein MTO96_049718 [Rhipicephalus appendiculatus]